jgi:hypothetical protein
MDELVIELVIQLIDESVVASLRFEWCLASRAISFCKPAFNDSHSNGCANFDSSSKKS